MIWEALLSAVNECFHRIIFFLALICFLIKQMFESISPVSSSSYMVIYFSSTQRMQNFIFAFPLYPSLSRQVFLGSLLLIYISCINQCLPLIQPCNFQIIFEVYPFIVYILFSQLNRLCSGSLHVMFSTTARVFPLNLTNSLFHSKILFIFFIGELEN